MGGSRKMGWNDWLNKLKNNSRFPKKNQLILILLVGLLLVVAAIPTKEQEVEEKSEETISEKTYYDTLDFTSYGEYLEKRIADALGNVEGVGKTEIVITLVSNGQKIIEKDQQSSSQKTSEQDSGGGTREVEDRNSEKTSVYIQESDGSQTPYVTEEMLPEIQGVLVIAEGGDNAVVVQNITEAIQALFGVEAHKIKIMKRTDT
ncbi:MAG: stage III sporulation protein AG [Schaedlerella sp.]|nr:stage III sporulation protein AG [Schaedlerella sp.]